MRVPAGMVTDAGTVKPGSVGLELTRLTTVLIVLVPLRETVPISTSPGSMESGAGETVLGSVATVMLRVGFTAKAIVPPEVEIAAVIALPETLALDGLLRAIVPATAAEASVAVTMAIVPLAMVVWLTPAITTITSVVAVPTLVEVAKLRDLLAEDTAGPATTLKAEILALGA